MLFCSDLAFSGTGRCVASSCPSERAYYQPGGTAMITRGNPAGHIHEQGSDKYGSFVWSTYRGKEGLGIILVSASGSASQRELELAMTP